MGDTIFALFGVKNAYDQPENNLEAFWHSKPSLETLANAIGHSFPSSSDDITLKIVKIWGGEQHRLGSTDYRLDEISPGKAI